MNRVKSRELTLAETDELLADKNRALDKTIAALEQLAHPTNREFAFFKDPARAFSSAGASTETMFPSIDNLARKGAAWQRIQSKAGFARHSSDNDPETYARHDAWRKAKADIVAEMKAECRGKPRGRQLASLICARVPNSNYETVRSWLKSEAKAKRWE